jgi:hypothetical protein
MYNLTRTHGRGVTFEFLSAVSSHSIFENSKKKKDRNEISKTGLRVNKRVVKIFQKEKKKK